jgi:23S rRNA (cytidine1920-2'-O)/16S rRNA (cytidine1409-2'-O)-methyltransferase
VVRRRLDEELVRRGLAVDRDDARGAVEAGLVRIGGSVAANASSLVAPADAVDRRSSRRRYVSRGGHKLEAALARFALDPTGADALDAGASTGGFTDCLLRAGAPRVVAVDVGYGDLAWTLRRDPRVVVMERTNVRELRAPSLPYAPELVVADLSFVPLRAVVPTLADVAAERARMVLLVKPQFEARRGEVSTGGVVRDAGVWRRSVQAVASACDAARFAPMGVMASPLLGPAGNVEFLLHAIRGVGPSGSAFGEAAVTTAMAEAADVASGTGS